MFGPLTPLASDEYRKVYQETGLDVDGRREFFGNLKPACDSVVEEIVKWAKTIPGFTDLTLSDQLKILRGIHVIFTKKAFSYY